MNVMLPRWSRLIRPLGWWLVLVALVVSGITTVADRGVHDALIRARGERATGHHVILVTLDHGSLQELGPLPWDWPQIQRLFAPVLAAEPPAIGVLPAHDVLFPAEAPPPGPLADALSTDRIVLATQLTRDEAGHLPGITFGAYGGRPDDPLRGSSTGVVELFPDRDGPVRRHPRHVDTAGGRLRTIEAVLLETAGISLAGDECIISYLGSPGSVARVSAERVVRGEIEPSVFFDRIVLIGITDPAIGQMVATPVGRAGDWSSSAEVHANVLATVADGRRVRAPVLPVLFLFAPLLMLIDLLYRKGEMVADLIVGVGSLAGLAAAVAAAHLAADLQLPAVAPGLAVVGLLGTELVGRLRRSQRRLQKILAELSVGPSFHSGSTSALDPEYFWGYLADFLSQFAGVDRVVVCERVGTRMRFRFTGARGVDLDEVQAEPTAVPAKVLQRAGRAGRPTVVPGTRWSNHEDLVAVALSAGGEVLGLALLVVVDGPTMLRTEGARYVAAGVVGGRLAEQFQSVQAGGVRDQGLLRTLRRVGIDHQIEMVGALTRLLLEERSQWEGILRDLPVGLLFSDMVGEVHLANDLARRLLDRSGYRFRPGANLSELLGAITGREPEDVAAALFMAYRSQDPTVFRWESGGSVRRTFRAVVSPVLEEPSSEARVLGTHNLDESRAPLGYLCAIEDATVAREMQRARSSVIEALGLRARTYLMVLQGLGDVMLMRDELDQGVAADVGRMLAQGRSLAKLLEDFAAVAGPVDEDGTGVLPVDLSQLAREVIDRVGEILAASERLEITAPVVATPVLLDKALISDALYRIASDSLTNSPADTVTSVSVAEGTEKVVVVVQDQGYGIPRTVLDHLERVDLDAEDLPEGLARARKSVVAGGGTLDIESVVGRGTTYRMEFPK